MCMYMFICMASIVIQFGMCLSRREGIWTRSFSRERKGCPRKRNYMDKGRVVIMKSHGNGGWDMRHIQWNGNSLAGRGARIHAVRIWEPCRFPLYVVASSTSPYRGRFLLCLGFRTRDQHWPWHSNWAPHIKHCTYIN